VSEKTIEPFSIEELVAMYATAQAVNVRRWIRTVASRDDQIRVLREALIRCRSFLGDVAAPMDLREQVGDALAATASKVVDAASKGAPC